MYFSFIQVDETYAKGLNILRVQILRPYFLFIDRGTPVTAGTVVLRRCNGDQSDLETILIKTQVLKY